MPSIRVDRRAKVSFYEMKDDAAGGESEIFVLKVPRTATKADLLDLKAFLQDEPRGKYRIELDLNGQKIDTKLDVETPERVKSWAVSRWG